MVVYYPENSLWNGRIFATLGGGFHPSEKYWSNWIISPGRGKNKTCLKPPPSTTFFTHLYFICRFLHLQKLCSERYPSRLIWTSEELKWIPSYTGSTWVNYKIIETLHASIYAACMPYRHPNISGLVIRTPSPNAYPKYFSPCVGMNGCLEMVPSFSNMYHMKQKNTCFSIGD